MIATRPPSSDESWAPFLPAPLAKPHVCGIRVFYSCFSASKWSRATRATSPVLELLIVVLVGVVNVLAHRVCAWKFQEFRCNGKAKCALRNLASLFWTVEGGSCGFDVATLAEVLNQLANTATAFRYEFLGFITIQVDYCTGIYVWFGNF